METSYIVMMDHHTVVMVIMFMVPMVVHTADMEIKHMIIVETLGLNMETKHMGQMAVLTHVTAIRRTAQTVQNVLGMEIEPTVIRQLHTCLTISWTVNEYQRC